MRVRRSVLVAVVANLLTTLPARAVSPHPEEMTESLQWVAANFQTGKEANKSSPFFSFTYDGVSWSTMRETWDCKRTARLLDDQRTEYTLTYTDRETGLVVRCMGIAYLDFPTVEWTLYFKNTGDQNTPILADIQAIDYGFNNPADGKFTLHYNRGDFRAAESYEPLTATMGPGFSQQFSPVGGKATNGQFPYWNVEMRDGGVLIALGWPGQWAAQFERDQSTSLNVRAGQELTHFTLHPGEEVRSPLVVLQFYRGGPVRAQNIWRRWMLAHNSPRPFGQPLQPMSIFCSGGFFPGLKVSAASEKQFIDVLTKEGIQLDYWWMDAGWYPCTDWVRTGTWEPDPERFPDGLKEISDYVHVRNMKLIVWFEPERSEPTHWLTVNHPEWLYQAREGDVVVNLGNPEALNWIINHFDQLITTQGIDVYRQDLNKNPLDSWRAEDAVDRQGIAEIKHVCGYLTLWDELQRRHPGLMIDSCAGGGRRNDLETLRRAVPLLRSDYQTITDEPEYIPGNQAQTYGLSSWLPFYGSGIYLGPIRPVENMRSSLCPSFGMCVDVRKGDIDWDLYRKLMAQWRQVAGCMLGDYYPLTAHSLSLDTWIAWQFNRPEQGDGMIQAFRRDYNPTNLLTAKLHGLEPEVVYAVKNLDDESVREISGRELMADGLAINITTQPGSALIYYRKKP